jgi:hypothetical protein
MKADGYIMNLHDHGMHYQRSVIGQLRSLFEHTITHGWTSLIATRFQDQVKTHTLVHVTSSVRPGFMI